MHRRRGRFSLLRQGIQVSHYLVPGQEQMPLVFLLGGVVVSLQEHLQNCLMLHYAVRLTDRVHQGKPPELADEGINAVVKLEQQGVPAAPDQHPVEQSMVI